jgi:DNA-binding response OmpR family regulator
VPSVHTILLYGRDELLLMTRGRILEGAGFKSAMTMDVREIPRLVRELPADLIVLCHSLSRTECVVAGMVAKNHRAVLRTLLIVADGSIGEGDYGMSEVAAEIFNLSLEPEKLVAKMRSMLDERPHSPMRTFPQPELVRRSFLGRTS